MLLLRSSNCCRDLQRCLILLICFYVNEACEKLHEHVYGNAYNEHKEHLFLRLFFYINSVILVIVSWRKFDGHELKAFIVKHLRHYNKLRRKAKKGKKRKRDVLRYT